MSEGPMRDEVLRDAFQALAGASLEACSAEDLERVWQAVSGSLDVPERRALVERMATDRALAEAWRVASELWRAAEAGSQTAAAPPAAPVWGATWRLAAAAVLAVAVAGSVMVLRRPPGDALREQPGVAIEALVAREAAVPRESFRLRWTQAPAGSRYDVRVTTEDLRVVANAADLRVAEFVVPAAELAGVPAGARLFWQVDAVLPDGSRVTSPTFVVTLR